MSNLPKTYFTCACGKKTSTTNAARAKAKACTACIPELKTAQAKVVTVAQKKSAVAKAAPQVKADKPVAQPILEKPVRSEASSPVSATKHVSALDAAAEVLRKASAPMSIKEIFQAIVVGGLWDSPKGKTPDQTIQAAIGREIRGKGTNSRFAKVARGRFATREGV
jgi:hypothetical protein